MDFNRIKLILHTVKYLRFEQVAYRVLYALKNRFVSKEYNTTLLKPVEPIQWKSGIDKPTSYLSNQTFRFLNITHDFGEHIDWNYAEYGKLWTYNLNYFDFLNQQEIQKSESLQLMHHFIDETETLKDGLEPYPISLRAINWIKYLSKENIADATIDESLYNQYLRLLDRLEYHLLGNHLLENGFSLLFGAYYFKDEKLYSKAKNIIGEELIEQILEDGGHFELSPMYHQIILDRLLDCIALVQQNPWKSDTDFLEFMMLKATLMLSWLNRMTFRNGDIPMMNDSAFQIAPSTAQINKYAKELGVFSLDTKLSDSGYRKFENETYEICLDVGEVGPTYQPGHAHADTFGFVLHANKKPLLVDPGISTYNMGEIRERERATDYHNTVTIDGENSSQVWAGFRVAKRAHVQIFQDDSTKVKASHNGYKSKGTKHTRSFQCTDYEIVITDTLDSSQPGEAHFHFHPDCQIQVISSEKKVKIEQNTITFAGSIALKEQSYQYAAGYNNLIEAKKLIVSFQNTLTTTIKIEGS
jgi:hypothetical protein